MKNQILKTKIKDLEDENTKLKVERDYEEMEIKESSKNTEKIEINKTLTHISKKRIKSSKNIGDL